MKILFLCTAHNSLSQRLYLDLTATGHVVSIEYALSDHVMIDAANLFCPHLVICPFLTVKVPQEIYNKYMTFIIHPGPPGDSGPSAIDWVLMGNDGSIDDSVQLLRHFDNGAMLCPSRSHWGVTVLQAMEDFDAGPVWAFEQFPIDIDQPNITKSSLYRGPITTAAITATRTAISRLHRAAQSNSLTSVSCENIPISPCLRPDGTYCWLSVTDNLPFKGGKVHIRPLLKATSRDFDLLRHSAKQISRRIRSADSQPGARSAIFGEPLYLYGGTIEENPSSCQVTALQNCSTKIIGIRNDAVCVKTCDDQGVWITHVRRLKGINTALWPKIPALPCLVELGAINVDMLATLGWPLPTDLSLSIPATFQEIWLDIRLDENTKRIAYLHFDFYNGAMSTDQCSRLLEAMDYILSQSSSSDPIHAVVLMGGGYFSNGINLAVIEAAKDAAMESWLNINRINDVVQKLLCDFPAKKILTIAAIRGNAAAGGVALATACDYVIAGAEVVLNPAYRAIGLHGSEFHTLSYIGRCGIEISDRILRTMQPMSPIQARKIGLVDFVFPGNGLALDEHIRYHVSLLLKAQCFDKGLWKTRIDCSPSAIAYARASELSEMAKDFWSARSTRYHSRRYAFVRKIKPSRTPTRFAIHRQIDNRTPVDEEETDQFDNVKYFERLAEQQILSRQQHESRALAEVTNIYRQNSRQSAPFRLEGFPNFQDSDMGCSAHSNESVVLFGCYYDPTEQLPTPPASPEQTPSLAKSFQILHYDTALEVV